MKLRIALVSVVTLLVSMVAQAETVMLYTHEAEDSDYLTLAGLDLAAAIEDGILAEFFDEGHIIFNYGLSAEAPETPPFVTDPAPVRVAKTGGASLLIEIEISNPATDRLVPESIRYVYRNVILEYEISRGVVTLGDIGRRGLTDPRAICTAFGEAIARSALGR